MDGVEAIFVAFGLVCQALLVAFFAARRWRPDVEHRLGLAAYACSGLGLPLGVGLLWAGAPATLAVGPLLTAGWAAFGAVVDVGAPRPWRGPPIQWAVMVPYVALFLFAQMWMWWPLWTISRAAWGCYLVLFVADTGLNIRGHVEAGIGR